MRFAVSREFVRPGRVGGLEQATDYYIAGLAAALGADDTLAVIGGGDTTLPEAVSAVAPPVLRSPRFLQETTSLRRLGPAFDSYFLPNYFTPPGGHKPRVVTMLPDLQYRHLPDNFSLQKRAWLRAAHRYTLRRADAVTVFSEFVRADIVDRYSFVDSSHVHVTPIPVDWSRFGPAASAVVRRQPYLLTVASHYRHKNLSTLVRAFPLVKAALGDVRLVMVGQLGSNLVGVKHAEDVRALVHELGLSGDIEVTGYVNDSALGGWYRGATAFVFPSVFEGFGLPPVEALGLGIPVLTTRCASLPEVTLGMAEYVDDPYNVEEMAARIVYLVQANRSPTPADVGLLRDFYSPIERGRCLLRVLRGG
jgi:glycosyltransferase involved in cell wall biosynthesis